MPKSTLFFLIFMSLLAGLLGYNYFFHPFAVLDENNQAQVEAPILADKPETASDELEQIFQLTPRQQIAALIAFPYRVTNSPLVTDTFPRSAQTSAQAGTQASMQAAGVVDGASALGEQKVGVQDDEGDDKTEVASDAGGGVAQVEVGVSLEWLKNNQPRVVTLFGEKISSSSAKAAIEKIQAAYTNNSLSDERNFFPLIAVDHEGGKVQRLSGSGFTQLPSWEAWCASNPGYRQELLQKSAQELAEVGVGVVFAPVVDVASQSGVLGSRICSFAGEVVAARASELINTYQAQNLLPVLKHFPGIGGVEVDLHHKFAIADLTEAGVLVFQELLTAYPQIGVMSAHVGVRDLYEDAPCSLNKACLEDLEDFFPETLIFSDALDMEAAGFQKNSAELLSLPQRALRALLAGNNILVFGPEVTTAQLDDVLLEIAQAYEADPTLQAQVKKSLTKLWKYQTSLRQ